MFSSILLGELREILGKIPFYPFFSTQIWGRCHGWAETGKREEEAG